MLERFKPRPEDAERISVDSLREVVSAIFKKMGVSKEDSDEAADVLVMTDLRGVETHGVSNMLRSYVERYNIGEANPTQTGRLKEKRQVLQLSTQTEDWALFLVAARWILR